MSGKIIIRKTVEADKPRIFELLRQANMHHIPSPEMPELTFGTYYVAEADGVIAGFCGDKVLSPTEAKTELMVVDRAFRGRGVGNLLQEFRMEKLAGAGIKTLTTNTDLPPTIAGKGGEPVCEKTYYREIIEGVRDRCPDLIVCASTSGRIHNAFAQRSDVLALGSLNFPKSASVTDPDMIRQLAESMKTAGIVPELEVFDTSMLYTMKEMIRTGILTPPFYCNLLLGSVFSTPATLFNLACLVKDMPYETLWAAAGR